MTIGLGVGNGINLHASLDCALPTPLMIAVTVQQYSEPGRSPVLMVVLVLVIVATLTLVAPLSPCHTPYVITVPATIGVPSVYVVGAVNEIVALGTLCACAERASRIKPKQNWNLFMAHLC
jgi:hypothetical protein